MGKKPVGLDVLSIKNKKGFNELKSRLLFVIVALFIFRVGSFIPIPGIDAHVLTKVLDKQQGTIIEMFNVFSGGALSRASIFTLGMMPHISASIAVQLLTLIHPVLIELKKEGESGKRKISQYTRYGTLVLAIFQSIGVAIGLPNMPGLQGVVISYGMDFFLTAIISLVCGSMFLMWLGEKITERGLGNGISIMIFTGILAGLPPSVIHTIEKARQGSIHFSFLLGIAIVILSVTFFVVFVERGQRKIVVNYAKIQHSRRVYATHTHSTHLPLKVNMAGVIPAIFASSLILFPATISTWFGGGIGCTWLTTLSLYLQPGQPLYIVFYTAAIVFFCFFYTSLVFNPRETADNLKRSGAFIPGIRPGEQTARYIDKIMTRITVFGSMYIVFICLIPEFMRDAMHVPFYFGGTSLLIVVVVIMDFMTQVQTVLMSSQYHSMIFKKAK